MIPLAVACALLFAWACIATSFAMHESYKASLYEDALNKVGEQREVDKDRDMAASLSEFHHARSVVTNAVPQTGPQAYASDPFGLLVEPDDSE